MKQPIKWVIVPVIRCILKAESIRPKVALAWSLRLGMLFQCPGGEPLTAWKSGSPLAWHREAGAGGARSPCQAGSWPDETG